MKSRDIGAVLCVVLVIALLVCGVALVLTRAKENFAIQATQPAGGGFSGEPADTSNLPTVYTNNFVGGDTRGWTTRLTDRTPNGQPFLGQFNNEQASLKISQLPEHLMLRLSFDLYVINTWDGSGVISAAGGKAGPDYFLLGVEDGPTLLCATFSNLPDTPNFAEDGKRQTYPSPIPSRPVKSGTGSSGIHSLGYVFTYNPPGVSFPQDSMYSMSFTFPHTADAVQFNFDGMGLQSIRDEGWGVANVKLELVHPTDAPNEEKLAKLWQKVIGEDDPVGARDAFWEMISARDATAKFLERQRIGFGFDQAKAEALIGKLDTLTPNQALTQELADMGPVIEPLLQATGVKTPSLKTVIDEVRCEIEVSPLESPAVRKNAAASRLLQIIGSAEAERVQTVLAGRPDPANKPGTPEYAGDWKRRFDVVYRLNAAENLKFIASPGPAEREIFLRQRRSRLDEPFPPGSRSVEPPLDTSPFVAYTGARLGANSEIGRFAPDYAYNDKVLPAKGLTRTLMMLGLYRTRTAGIWRKIDVSPSLEDIDLAGDWLVRPRVSQQKMLDALSQIIFEQTKRRVRFVSATEQEDVIVVRGVYAFKPEDVDHTDGILRVYGDRLNDPRREVFVQESSLGGLLGQLTGSTGVRFIDETGSGKQKIKWGLHASAFPRSPGMSEATRALLLDHLSKQSGLSFTREPRPMEKLIATEEKP